MCVSGMVGKLAHTAPRRILQAGLCFVQCCCTRTVVYSVPGANGSNISWENRVHKWQIPGKTGSGPSFTLLSVGTV